jgi:hypothetical protein
LLDAYRNSFPDFSVSFGAGDLCEQVQSTYLSLGTTNAAKPSMNVTHVHDRVLVECRQHTNHSGSAFQIQARSYDDGKPAMGSSTSFANSPNGEGRARG